MERSICGEAPNGTFCLLLRGDDCFAIFFQCGNIIRDDLPSGFGVNGAVAVRYNVPHGLDLPPRNGGVLRPELVRQLTYQFSDLQDTEGCSITVNGISIENFRIIRDIGIKHNIAIIAALKEIGIDYENMEDLSYEEEKEKN